MANLKEQLIGLNRVDALNLSETQLEAKVETTIANTFMWMGAVLLVAFGVAYASSLGFIPLGFSSTGYWISRIAGMGIIFWMNSQRQSLNYTALAGLLLLFGLLQGYGLTGVFLSYSMGSIYQVFLSSAILFFVLAFAGYHTKIDVARTGPILFWAMIALFISMLANSFILGNPIVDVWLSVIGIVVFGGFIIYDMNILKQQALTSDRRIELLMALGLFINFINIFMFMMRLFGGGDE